MPLACSAMSPRASSRRSTSSGKIRRAEGVDDLLQRRGDLGGADDLAGLFERAEREHDGVALSRREPLAVRVGQAGRQVGEPEVGELLFDLHELLVHVAEHRRLHRTVDEAAQRRVVGHLLAEIAQDCPSQLRGSAGDEEGDQGDEHCSNQAEDLEAVPLAIPGAAIHFVDGLGGHRAVQIRTAQLHSRTVRRRLGGGFGCGQSCRKSEDEKCAAPAQQR